MKVLLVRSLVGLLLLVGTASAQTATPTSTPTSTPSRTPTSTPLPTSTLGDLSIVRIFRTPLYRSFDAKTLPTPGESISINVEVKNTGGGSTESATLNCTLNGVSLESRPISGLAVGASQTEIYPTIWGSPLLTVCTLSTGQTQITTQNDTLSVDLYGSPVNIYIEQAVEDWHAINAQSYCGVVNMNCQLRSVRTSFDDWVLSSIDRINERFTNSDVERRFYLNEIIVIPNGTFNNSADMERSCSGGTLNNHDCDTAEDCPSGTCQNCLTGITYNSCDKESNAQWGHPSEDANTLWGAPPSYASQLDVDNGWMHELTHAAGVIHNAIGATNATDVAIEDPPSTPVADTLRMPRRGVCAGGAQAGGHCLQQFEGTDCPGSTCSANAIVNFPPEEPDMMGGGDDEFISQWTRMQLDALVNERCRSPIGSNANNDFNWCAGEAHAQHGAHGIWGVAFDGNNDRLGSQQIDFYRTTAFSQGLTRFLNQADNTIDFTLTSDPNGIVFLGEYPWVPLTEPNHPAYFCNNQDSGSCSNKMTPQVWRDTRSPNSAFIPDRAYDIFERQEITGLVELDTIIGQDADGTMTRFNLIARAESGDISYTWLYWKWSAIARSEGHLRAYVPLWFRTINLELVDKPDLVVLPLTISHDACPLGGRCWMVRGAVSNLGQNLAAGWAARWEVDGTPLSSTTHTRLWMGATEYGFSYLANPGEQICLRADPANAVAERREDNNVVCITSGDSG